jgi:hypothetical protein
MGRLEEWTRQAIDDLGLDPETLDQGLILDLAREVAHGVARPAAPLTTYLLGVAVGRGANPAEAAAQLTKLAGVWRERGSQP